MRMNGSCAGGTGAFIDEMAKLMGVGTESGEFEQLASWGTTVHEVSGRCGVYAKTDIQPLLNEGIPTTDLRFRRFTRSPAKRSAVWPRVSTSSRR